MNFEATKFISNQNKQNIRMIDMFISKLKKINGWYLKYKTEILINVNTLDSKQWLCNRKSHLANSRQVKTIASHVPATKTRQHYSKSNPKTEFLTWFNHDRLFG